MRTFTLLAVAASLTACNPTRDADPDQDKLESNKAIIVQLNDAQNAKDLESMASLMAPDLVRHCQATPDTVDSREDYLALIESWQNIIPDAHQVINQIIAEDDMVAVHATLTGTQTGPMGPIPPTNKQFVSNALAMFRIENGLVQEIWVEWDNVAILSQLGVMPEPGDSQSSS